jgi:hypothetical protein
MEYSGADHFELGTGGLGRSEVVIEDIVDEGEVGEWNRFRVLGLHSNHFIISISILFYPKMFGLQALLQLLHPSTTHHLYF